MLLWLVLVEHNIGRVLQAHRLICSSILAGCMQESNLRVVVAFG